MSPCDRPSSCFGNRCTLSLPLLCGPYVLPVFIITYVPWLLCPFADGKNTHRTSMMVGRTLPIWVESVSTIGRGRGTTVPSPGRSSKQPLPGIGLHDPLLGRQACAEFNLFHQRVGQMSPRWGFFRAVPSQSG